MKLHWLRADASYPTPKIPLAWAAALMIAGILPLSFYLGPWNVPLWVSFIVWAEYFVLGGNVDTGKVMIPSLSFGALIAALWCHSSLAVASMLGNDIGQLHGLYLAYAITNFIWVPVLIYACQWVRVFEVGALAVFNGFTLFLAVYFTGSEPDVAPSGNNFYAIWWPFLWTVLLMCFGWLLGWLNVVLMFTSEPEDV